MGLQSLLCATRSASLLFTLIGLVATLPASGTPIDGGVKVDAEIDPTAYLLHGYSAHLGLSIGRLRCDLGVYAADVPRWLQGNSGFDTSERGVGVKAQYFVNDSLKGWFVGTSVGPVQERIENRASGVRASRTLYGVGIETGFRVNLGRGFYATPWLGMDYLPGASDLLVDGQLYAEGRWQPFAALHVGLVF